MHALEIMIILSEVIQTQNDKYIACMWNLKKWYKWIYLQKFTKQEGEKTGIDIYSLTNKDLLYSTGNSTQYSVMTYMWIESKKEWL